MAERDAVRFGTTMIEYEVIRSSRRRKTVEITLDPARGVLVAAPDEAPVERIRAIVARRAGWIIRTSPQRGAPVVAPRWVSGEPLPYLGRNIRLRVETSSGDRTLVRFNHWRLHVEVPTTVVESGRSAAIQRAVTAWYRVKAGERLPERVARWAALAGYTLPRVLIRDQRQRWASCSPDGVLRFNWRVIMAPPRLIDYIVVHELAHLRVRRHTPQFWGEVARLLPDHATRRRQLSDYGASLPF